MHRTSDSEIKPSRQVHVHNSCGEDQGKCITYNYVAVSNHGRMCGTNLRRSCRANTALALAALERIMFVPKKWGADAK